MMWWCDRHMTTKGTVVSQVVGWEKGADDLMMMLVVVVMMMMMIMMILSPPPRLLLLWSMDTHMYDVPGYGIYMLAGSLSFPIVGWVNHSLTHSHVVGRWVGNVVGGAVGAVTNNASNTCKF